MRNVLNKDGAVAVCDTNGGQLISYQDKNGTEYVWNGDAKYWGNHGPVLFPHVGALKNSRVKYEGKEYESIKHGAIRQFEFATEYAKEDEVQYSYTYSEESLKSYPYKFKLFITHKMIDNGIRTSYTVKSLDEKPIWFCIGGHQGYNCPIFEGEQFSDYDLIFEAMENSPAYYTDAQSLMHKDYYKNLLVDTDTLPMNHDDYDVDVLIFDKLRSNRVKLVNRNTGKGILFDYSGFKSLGVWTPPNKKAPFVCLECWVGLPADIDASDNFEEKPYAIKLAPDGEYEVSYSITVL